MANKLISKRSFDYLRDESLKSISINRNIRATDFINYFFLLFSFFSIFKYLHVTLCVIEQKQC